MDQTPRDYPADTISDFNPMSPTPDDSFLKTPTNSVLKSMAKLYVASNSSIDGSTRNIIKRMQEEIDALLHENAELKSRGSAYTNDQNNNYNIFNKRNKNTDCSSKREVGDRDDEQRSLAENNAIIECLTEKVDEFQEKVKLLEKENRSLQIEVKKRDNYLQQKLQLEIDLKKNMRLNQELQAKLDVQEHISTRQNSIVQDSSLMIEDAKSDKYEEEIRQKNKKIEKLDQENNLSKDMNQTLVKLLKLKNLQIQANRILSKKEESDIDTTKKNLEKFENEEKKLLRILEIKMKQYGEIENEQET